jgi:hypothetical protein
MRQVAMSTRNYFLRSTPSPPTVTKTLVKHFAGISKQRRKGILTLLRTLYACIDMEDVV